MNRDEMAMGFMGFIVLLVLFVFYPTLALYQEHQSGSPKTFKEAQTLILKEKKNYDFSRSSCNDTEIHVANAYLLASSIENHNTSNPLDSYRSLKIKEGNVEIENASSNLLENKKFQKSVTQATCHVLNVESSYNSKNFKVTITNEENSDELKVYDSSDLNDKKNLEKFLRLAQFE